jgi:hypothetical protein
LYEQEPKIPWATKRLGVAVVAALVQFASDGNQTEGYEVKRDDQPFETGE